MSKTIVESEPILKWQKGPFLSFSVMNLNLRTRVFGKLFKKNSLEFEFRGLERFDLDILVSFWAILHYRPSWVAV